MLRDEMNKQQIKEILKQGPRETEAAEIRRGLTDQEIEIAFRVLELLNGLSCAQAQKILNSLLSSLTHNACINFF